MRQHPRRSLMLENNPLTKKQVADWNTNQILGTYSTICVFASLRKLQVFTTIEFERYIVSEHPPVS